MKDTVRSAPTWCSVGATCQNRVVTIDKKGKLWRGEDFADLAEYIREFQAEGYPVSKVVESVCDHCNGRAFRVLVDDTEGCAQRVCGGCGAAAFIADSAQYWKDAADWKINYGPSGRLLGQA
jgi:hypothetical protein